MRLTPIRLHRGAPARRFLGQGGPQRVRITAVAVIATDGCWGSSQDKSRPSLDASSSCCFNMSLIRLTLQRITRQCMRARGLCDRQDNEISSRG